MESFEDILFIAAKIHAIRSQRIGFEKKGQDERHQSQPDRVAKQPK